MERHSGDRAVGPSAYAPSIGATFVLADASEDLARGLGLRPSSLDAGSRVADFVLAFAFVATFGLVCTAGFASALGTAIV
mmetsp:Transcript_18983/g.53537  ORF Transcript_18983/g.53537 Transcript_18983/m.53537 type:complete len:80 (-) Transcript_18983:606-845(-)